MKVPIILLRSKRKWIFCEKFGRIYNINFKENFLMGDDLLNAGRETCQS